MTLLTIEQHAAQTGGSTARTVFTFIPMVHIGKEIKRKMEERQRTVVWAARHLSCSRTNVYKIFDKYTIDTDSLTRISRLLDFDFFSLYSDELTQK